MLSSELDALRDEIADIIKDQLAPLRYDDMFPEHQDMVDGIVALIAQREQAAVEAVTPITIMGKTIEEICVILSALELERIADMQMTMSRLDDWMKLVREDHRKAVQKALNKTLENTLKQATNPEKGE